MLLKCKQLHPEAKLPYRAYKNDAGIDLYSIEGVTIPPGLRAEVRTGIAVEVPKGYHIQLHTRSSYGKCGLRCHLGIIDQYRDELTIFIYNHNKHSSYYVKKGDKICQIIILPVPEVTPIWVNELSESERGLKGHGSSGR